MEARASERLAPAKVNLFLHVGPLGPDGYHPICSLMVFADIGDTLRLAPAAAMAFEVEGPFAAFSSVGPDNLVRHARDRLFAEFAAPPSPFRLTLDKQLPLAAGLGGGSADAAATLELVAWFIGALPPARLEAIARDLGADVAACLAARALVAEGRGERLAAAPRLPPLAAVLVNPGAPSPTAAVYRAFDESPGETPAPARADRPALPAAFRTPAAVAAFLATTRNDLEAPAIAGEPRIAQALAALREEPETLFARMSGSGASSFALCENREAARRLAGRLAAAHPAWWVRACVLR
ncbi:MAG: 4-(cytidine 5'-diphospho)-2-C-methyl-D-erythritol kinase [Caulobacteraceae bacterium]